MTTPTHSICDACETVAHCSVNGCIPAIPTYHLRSYGCATKEQIEKYGRSPTSTAPPPPVGSQRPEWTSVSQKLLAEGHSWLYKPCWIALNTGEVTTGYYHWRQGRSPDRFITELGDLPAFDALYVAPLIVPTHPDARM
jgi:hypothetical protein